MCRKEVEANVRGYVAESRAGLTCISINRTAIKPESAVEFERIAAAWLRSERGRLPLDAPSDRHLVRADGGAEYTSDHGLGDPEGP